MALIYKIVNTMSFDAEVREKTISTTEEATEYHFLGSPSVGLMGLILIQKLKIEKVLVLAEGFM